MKGLTSGNVDHSLPPSTLSATASKAMVSQSLGGKNTKHTGNTVHCRPLVVSPPDRGADWELRLNAAAQHHQRIVPHYRQPGNDQNSKFKVQFLWHGYCFHTIIKPENPKSNHHKSGTVCTVSCNICSSYACV